MSMLLRDANALGRGRPASRGVVFQDWTSVGTDTASAGTSISQATPGWLDLGGVRDLVLLLEVAQVSASAAVTMFYESAPVRDVSLFRSVGSYVGPSPAFYPWVTRISLYDNPAEPVSRWLRWRANKPASGGSPDLWSITFRITAMAYAR
jgi:hypothetical protein